MAVLLENMRYRQALLWVVWYLIHLKWLWVKNKKRRKHVPTFPRLKVMSMNTLGEWTSSVPPVLLMISALKVITKHSPSWHHFSLNDLVYYYDKENWYHAIQGNFLIWWWLGIGLWATQELGRARPIPPRVRMQGMSGCISRCPKHPDPTQTPRTLVCAALRVGGSPIPRQTDNYDLIIRRA